MSEKLKLWWQQFDIYFSKCRETVKTDKDTRELVSVWDLFKYGSSYDKRLAIIGMTAATFVGTSLVIPYFVNFMIAGVLITHGKPYDSELYPQTMPWIIGNVVIAIVMFAAAFVQKYCLNRACVNITAKLRVKFIEALLKQDASYLDMQEFGAVNQQLSESIDIISDGIGEKIGLIIVNISVIVTCVICGIFITWQGTLINFIVFPIVLFFTIFIMKKISISTKKQEPYAEKAATVIQESIVNVKTVQSCNGQAQMVTKLKWFLTKRRIYAIWNYFLDGFFEAFVYLVLYIFCLITTYYNAMTYYNGDITEPSKVLIVPSIIFSTVYFSAKNSPAIVAFTKARVAASTIYEKIEKVAESVKSAHLDDLKVSDGNITFSNVTFSYPNCQKVLKGLSFTAEPGKTTALVGHSGCGKSTTISLLLRLYEIESGSISIDSVDIRLVNPGSIRRAVGLVRQEPVLFGGTIADNIRLGDVEITDEQIEHACKVTNAHSFIMRLSHGYSTQIGPGSVQLSGGQKQRIAIARAIVTDPKILILDEATSALDVHSEMEVQKALKAASKGRTTIVIAHRMSTLCDASKILVIGDGKVVESGTHNKLQQSGGLYSNFVKAQELKDSEFDTVEIDAQNDPALDPSDVSPKLIDASDEIEASNEERKKNHNGISLLLRNLKGYRTTFAITICLSILRGLEMPLYAYLNIIIFNSLKNVADWANYHYAILSFCGLMIALGVYMFFMIPVAITLHGWVAENVVDTIKVRFLASTLNRDGAFFDNAETSHAKLVSLMNSEAPEIKSALDHRLFTLVSHTFAIIMLLIEATVFCWQMALAGIGWCVFVMTSFFICMRLSQRHTSQGISKTSHANVAVEIIENVKTIQLLNREKYFVTKFAKAIDDVKHDVTRATIYDSIVFAIGIGGVFFADVISYSVGVPLIYYEKVNSDSVFIAAMAVNVICWNVFFTGITCLEVLRAEPAAAAILPLLDDNVQNDGTVLEAGMTGLSPNIEGSVSAEDIEFAYPTRPTFKVANGLSFKAPRGQMIALVGPSGGGKSTVLALLERFYPFKSGELTIDGIPVDSINLHHLRNHIALVGQEPVLFAGTIKDNILLGIENGLLIDVESACRLANAADFIEKLPLGYETQVGEKGALLSGGQKQRIAIARAIARNPTILLLDEATSALDSESEKAVQQALNSAAKSRTVISIAHRLSSIQNADCIYFIENGSVLESGTHSELVSSGGKYAGLARKQMLQR